MTRSDNCVAFVVTISIYSHTHDLSWSAQVYLSCPTGGAVIIDMNKLYRGKFEIYTDHETSGQMKRTFGPAESEEKFTLEAKDLVKETRVRLIFYPDSASEISEARVEIRAENVDPHVEMCMTSTECLGILGDGIGNENDKEANFALRNKNKFQLDCLSGNTMPDKLQKKCEE